MLYMPKQTDWTENEIQRLKRLYPSDVSFEEIVVAFPERTRNALRLKASRLGLRRPLISSSIFSPSTILMCSEVNGNSLGYLFRCGECSNWIQVNGDDEQIESVIVCSNCGTKCYYAT